MLNTQISGIDTAINALSQKGNTAAATAKEWVELFCYPESDNANINPLQVAVSVTGNRVIINASNDRPILGKQFAQLLNINKYPEVELKLFQMAFKELPTAQLSCEVEMREDARDVRWLAKGVLPISAALKLLPEGTTATALKKWYAEADSDACLAVGRSVGGGYTCWETALPGDTTAQEIQAYNYLCQLLAVDPLPSPILEEIIRINPAEISVAARFTKNGATKLGLVINEPEADIVKLALLALSTDDSLLEMAAFEGALGKNTADQVEFATMATGVEAQLVYKL